MAQRQSGPVASEFLERQTLVRPQESLVSFSQGGGRLSCLGIASWGLSKLSSLAALQMGHVVGGEGGHADQLGDVGR